MENIDKEIISEIIDIDIENWRLLNKNNKKIEENIDKAELLEKNKAELIDTLYNEVWDKSDKKQSNILRIKKHIYVCLLKDQISKNVDRAYFNKIFSIKSSSHPQFQLTREKLLDIPSSRYPEFSPISKELIKFFTYNKIIILSINGSKMTEFFTNKPIKLIDGVNSDDQDTKAEPQSTCNQTIQFDISNDDVTNLAEIKLKDFFTHEKTIITINGSSSIVLSINNSWEIKKHINSNSDDTLSMDAVSISKAEIKPKFNQNIQKIDISNAEYCDISEIKLKDFFTKGETIIAIYADNFKECFSNKRTVVINGSTSDKFLEKVRDKTGLAFSNQQEEELKNLCIHNKEMSSKSEPKIHPPFSLSIYKVKKINKDLYQKLLPIKEKLEKLFQGKNINRQDLSQIRESGCFLDNVQSKINGVTLSDEQKGALLTLCGNKHNNKDLAVEKMTFFEELVQVEIETEQEIQIFIFLERYIHCVVYILLYSEEVNGNFKSLDLLFDFLVPGCNRKRKEHVKEPFKRYTLMVWYSYLIITVFNMVDLNNERITKSKKNIAPNYRHNIDDIVKKFLCHINENLEFHKQFIDSLRFPTINMNDWEDTLFYCLQIDKSQGKELLERKRNLIKILLRGLGYIEDPEVMINKHVILKNDKRMKIRSTYRANKGLC